MTASSRFHTAMSVAIAATVFVAAGPVAFFALTDLFIVAAAVHDLVSRGRVHPTYVWGGLLIVISQPLRLAMARTDAWAAFAGAVLG